MTEKKYKLYDVGSSYMTQCGVKSNNDCFENMAECCEELNRLADKNEQLKKVLDTHLNKSYVELNKFKSLKNPSNPERVRKQIIIRDAEIMLLIRILKEIDSQT